MCVLKGDCCPKVLEFIDALENHEVEERKKPKEDRNMCVIGTDPQTVVDCICQAFLGESYSIVDPVSTIQANTIILDEILYRFYQPYSDEMKSRTKRVMKDD